MTLNLKIMGCSYSIRIIYIIRSYQTTGTFNFYSILNGQCNINEALLQGKFQTSDTALKQQHEGNEMATNGKVNIATVEL